MNETQCPANGSIQLTAESAAAEPEDWDRVAELGSVGSAMEEDWDRARADRGLVLDWVSISCLCIPLGVGIAYQCAVQMKPGGYPCRIGHQQASEQFVNSSFRSGIC